MSNLRRNTKIILLLSVFLFTTTQLWGSDPLTEPVSISSRSTSSVLLSLARAGDRLVAVGERGFILTSDDLGRDWHQAQVPVSVTLTAVQFVTPQKGWAVGHDGVVLGSSDGGKSWQKLLDGNMAAAIELKAAQQANDPPSKQGDRRVREGERMVASGADKPFLALHFFDEQRGLVVGAYGLIFATTDGGETWKSLIGNVPNRMGKHLYDICVAGDDIYLIGEQGLVVRTDKKMEHFETIETPYEGSFFGMLSSQSGDLVLFGLRGHVFRSSDRGEHWAAIQLPQPITLTSGTRLDNGALVLADEAGDVYLSTDQGEHFNQIPVENPSTITDVLQVSDGVLMASGLRGIKSIKLEPAAVGAIQ